MPTILIVEDDADLARSFIDLLRPLKANVIVARDGAEALELLATMKVDCVILDLFMPRINGWEFLDFRKKSEALTAIRVLVVSAYAGIGLELPADVTVLAKPFGASEFVEAVTGVMHDVPGRADMGLVD